MAKKKAELQAERDIYDQHIVRARRHLTDGLFKTLVHESVAALPFVDGMMEFERRFEDAEFKSVEAIDNILRYAPLVFDRQSLVTLAAALKAQKRIDRNATDDLAARLERANEQLWLNYHLWVHIEKQGEVRQDELRLNLERDQTYWRWVCEAWEAMGLAIRTPSRGSYIVSLQTRSGEVVLAKCSACGEVQEAPKAIFFEFLNCPDCSKTSMFVILAAR